MMIQIDYEIPEPQTQEQTQLRETYINQKFLETISKLALDGVQFNRIDFGNFKNYQVKGAS